MELMRGVTHATPGRHDSRYGIGVELSCDRQSELRLVKKDGRFESSIEFIGEVRVGYREVTETVEVPLELPHTGYVAALPGV